MNICYTLCIHINNSQPDQWQEINSVLNSADFASLFEWKLDESILACQRAILVVLLCLTNSMPRAGHICQCNNLVALNDLAVYISSNSSCCVQLQCSGSNISYHTFFSAVSKR